MTRPPTGGNYPQSGDNTPYNPAYQNYGFCTFKGTKFDWEAGSPKRVVQDGATHYQGTIIVYRQDDLDKMFGYRRPCTVRAAGDPTAGGMVYVDHWGTDPSGLLQLLMSIWNPSANYPYPTLVGFTAILVDISRNETMMNGIHRADADFLIMQNVLTSIPPQNP